jgi:subtilisin family serine protease
MSTQPAIDPMREKHVILRTTAAATRALFLGSVSAPTVEESVAAGVSVEVEDIDIRTVSALARKTEVLSIAPVIPMRLIAPVEVLDTVQPTADGVAWGVKAVGADTSPFSGDGVVVAVLDTGIDASHPAFAGVDIIQKDFTGEGNRDENGHGTHCAGTVFGRTTNGTQIGVAPGVKNALIGKVLGTEGGGSSDQIASAIQWAVNNGANVVSMSLGIDFPGLVKRLETGGFPAELTISRARGRARPSKPSPLPNTL